MGKLGRNLAIIGGAAGLLSYLALREGIDNGPLESVAEAQRRAKRRLPAPVYKALISGNERGVTIESNERAFSEIGWIPVAARDTPEESPLERDLSRTSLGMDLSVPFMVGPAGAQAIHPDAEVAVASAANKIGTAIGLSSFATKSFEEVINANPNAMYQLYWTGSRDDILWRVERAKKAGSKALIVTIDAQGGGLGRRDWGSPKIPADNSYSELVKFVPMALSRPKWLAEFLVRGGIPELNIPNSANGPGHNPSFMETYQVLMSTPLPTWEDIKWLREQWGGKFVVKGIFRTEDAKRAIDVGADAIVVSNHGGNNLDSTYASIRALPSLAKVIGDQAEVWFDGGIRRGMDIAKALALGADVVLLGRAWLWGLAANGEQGVHDILNVLKDGLHFALVGLGHKSIDDLNPDDVIAPEGFFIEV